MKVQKIENITFYEALTIKEKEVLYESVNQLIDLLDDKAIKEFLNNKNYDINLLFDALLEETYNIFNLKKYDKNLSNNTLENLPHLKAGYEEYLRKLNLNYFVHSVLPDFEMNWHCFGKGTEVRMFDGSTKKIEDVCIGDVLMGPDSKKRNVTKTFSGKNDLYNITMNGCVESFIVTENHLLLFYDKNGICKKVKPSEIPINVKNTVFSSNNKRAVAQLIKSFELEENLNLELEPYFLGLWLGDGISTDSVVAAADNETVQYLKEYCDRLDMDCVLNKSIKWRLRRKIGSEKENLIRSLLRKYKLISNKHIPKDYFNSSIKQRLELLAGFLDSDGTLTQGNTFVCTNINERLIKEYFHLVQSLGFQCSLKSTHYVYEKNKYNSNVLWVLTISGNIDSIPTKIKRKRAICLYKRKNFSRIYIKKSEYIGRGDYYGFECDGDHTFLLKNGIVAHNCIEWFSMIQIYRLLCIIAARDNSKSFSFSFAHVLWRLYRYSKPTELSIPPDDIKFYKEGMIITNEFKLAKRLLKKVKDEIQSNQILYEALYPEKNIGGWANESISCKNGAEVTLSSFHTSNRGPHPGWIVVDDFLDKSALYSKDQRDKFFEVFNAEIMNMILPQGQVVVVGTPFHEKDLYASLKEDNQWRVFEYPGIWPNGELLWPNRYNFKALMAKRKALGSMIFSREILVRPVSDSTSIFPWSILENSFVNMNSICLVDNIQSYPIKLKRVAVGVDLALSASIGADYTVFVVVGEDAQDQIHLLNLIRLHGCSYNEQIATLQRVNSNFNPSVILMETNGFQKIMAGLAKESGINNIIEETTTSNTKKDLYNGLPSLAVLFERGTIKFPRGDERSKELTNIICSELNSIAFDDGNGKLESVSEHDDTAMSLFLAIKGLKTINNSLRLSMI